MKDEVNQRASLLHTKLGPSETTTPPPTTPPLTTPPPTTPPPTTPPPTTPPPTTEHYIFVQFMQFPGVGSLWFLALQLKSWGWREIECVQKQSNLHSASIKNIFQVFYKTFFLSFSNCITVERFQVKKLSCLLLADINGSGGFFRRRARVVRAV